MMNGSGVVETYQVLLKTLVTEKSTYQRTQLNQFSFRVPVAATKDLIRQAVLEAFGVKAVSVATQIHKECARRYRFHRGYTAAWKKAIVTVHKEETLPVS